MLPLAVHDMRILRLVWVVRVLALLGLFACGDSTAGDGAGGASGNGQGGNAGSWSGAYGPNSCILPLPDPGDDECLACAFEHCCGPEVGSCLSSSSLPPDAAVLTTDSSCYEKNFVGCIQGCFERLRQESTESSWRIAARCNNECFATSELDYGFFRGPALTLCLIGTTIPDEDEAADGGLDGDAGLDITEPLCPYGGVCECPQTPCVEKCFPGWTD